jgi:hypothetical protein
MKRTVEDTYQYFEGRIGELFRLLSIGSLGIPRLAEVSKEAAEDVCREDTSDIEARRWMDLTFEVLTIYGIVIMEEMVKQYVGLQFEKHSGSLDRKGDRNDDREAKTLTYREILEAESDGYAGVLSLMTEKELYKLGRGDIDTLDSRVKVLLGSPLSDAVDWEKMRKAYYVRNLLVHNRGIIGPVYVKKMKTGEIGKQVGDLPRVCHDLVSSLQHLNDHLKARLLHSVGSC